MKIRELIERLYQHHEDYGQGYTQNFYEVCFDCKQAANKLDELQRFIDDMLGDHYVDCLEFYTNRCRELEEQSEAQLKDIRELAAKSGDTCKYCKHNTPCLGKECKHYIEGKGLRDKNGYEFDWQWSCEDFNYGECDLLMNMPCHGCIKNNYNHFEYKVC